MSSSSEREPELTLLSGNVVLVIKNVVLVIMNVVVLGEGAGANIALR
jgi:hypothetical protein